MDHSTIAIRVPGMPLPFAILAASDGLYSHLAPEYV
jgi:hypothetical protein